VLLAEGLIRDAIAVVEPMSYSYDLQARVADAAIQTHPEWVIRVSRGQAESIMDAGKSRAYDHAIEWLRRARAAWLAAGREAEWQAYLNVLLDRHRRKYSLVPMLKRLAV
jgi:uncharacterized Zn finger protein